MLSLPTRPEDTLESLLNLIFDTYGLDLLFEGEVTNRPSGISFMVDELIMPRAVTYVRDFAVPGPNDCHKTPIDGHQQFTNQLEQLQNSPLDCLCWHR